MRAWRGGAGRPHQASASRSPHPSVGQELGDARGIPLHSPTLTTEVARGAFATELGQPSFVLNLLGQVTSVAYFLNGLRSGIPHRATSCAGQQGLVDDFIEGGFGRQSDDDPAVDERRRSCVDPQVFPFLACCLDS